MTTTAHDVWLLSVGATFCVVFVLIFLFLLLRRRENIYVAVVLTAIAYDKFTGVIGIRFILNGDGVLDAFAWLRASGTMAILLSVIVYGLHRFGLLNGVK